MVRKSVKWIDNWSSKVTDDPGTSNIKRCKRHGGSGKGVNCPTCKLEGCL